MAKKTTVRAELLHQLLRGLPVNKSPLVMVTSKSEVYVEDGKGHWYFHDKVTALGSLVRDKGANAPFYTISAVSVEADQAVELFTIERE